MSKKRTFTAHFIRTRYYEFTVYAADEEAARDLAWKVWKEAATVGQWEVADNDTELSVDQKKRSTTRPRAGEPLKAEFEKSVRKPLNPGARDK